MEKPQKNFGKRGTDPRKPALFPDHGVKDHLFALRTVIRPDPETGKGIRYILDHALSGQGVRNRTLHAGRVPDDFLPSVSRNGARYHLISAERTNHVLTSLHAGAGTAGPVSAVRRLYGKCTAGGKRNTERDPGNNAGYLSVRRKIRKHPPAGTVDVYPHILSQIRKTCLKRASACSCWLYSRSVYVP